MGDPDRSDVDAQFAEIIAHWSDDALSRPGAAPWPEAEGVDDPVEGGDPPPAPPGAGATPGGGANLTLPPPASPPVPSPGPPPDPPATPTPAAGSGPRPAEPGASAHRDEPQEDPEEHFHPGPTQPLPAGDLQFWGIVIGLTGGPLLLLYLVLFNRDASSLWLLLSIAMTVGGFAMLVSRLPGHRDEDDDDDGARL